MRFRRAVGVLAILALPAVIATMAATTATTTVQGWKTFGPPGTRVNAVSGAADDDGRAYAAATILESGTSALYRTDDAGQTWTGLADAAAGDAYSNVFADPRGGNRVFASTQRGNGQTDVYR